jgi:peptidoglycan/LPS O-acetylase OafA/YrhL
MKKELSVYLDLVRFSAAMIVFLGHAAGNLTGGFLWQLSSYLSAAVMVFFVLSGFVIAFVYDTKEKTLTDYSIARVARLSSVIYPALILTFLCDKLGIFINYELYFGGPWPQPDSSLINYVLSGLLLQNIWGLELNPGINVPFWSLSFELMFYALFAAFVYLKCFIRIVFLILICLLSGPDILIYFPIWLLGVGIYYLFKYYSHMIYQLGIYSIIISVGFLVCFIIFVPIIKQSIEYTPSILLSKRNVGADYLVAFLFTGHLMFVLPILSLVKDTLTKASKVITYFASLTFSLYLFHRPLLQLFASFFEDLSSWESRIVVIGGTFLVTLVIGRWCENQKYPIKQLLVSKFKKLKEAQ